MRIERASFGSLVIDGHAYHTDLIIYPEGRVEENWRRARGHKLDLEDIRALVDASPEIIIAGTGITGLMRPQADLEGKLKALGIDFHFARNKKALKFFNDLPPSKRVGACFHLTC